MNALTFNTILPRMLIRRAHQASTIRAALPAPVLDGAPVAATTPVPCDVKTTAMNVRQDFSHRDLAPLLKLVAWIFEPMAQRKNIRLRMEAPEIGLYATCQEVRIQRVLESLLANALRYAPANSQITLAARVEDGWLCIWVDDQGVGVPPSEQPTLFVGHEISFGQYALGVNEDKHALVVCKEIVSAHGGEILMYNRSEGGAHFEFRLPSSNGLRHRPHHGTFTTSARPDLVKIQPVLGRVA